MMCPDYCTVDHLQTGVATTAVVECFEEQLPQTGKRPTPELTVNRGPFAKMFVQIAPRNTRPCDPENPIQNKPMIPRTATATRPSFDHKWLQASPFLITHQTSDHGSLLKSYCESDTTPFGNPLCQQNLSQPAGCFGCQHGWREHIKMIWALRFTPSFDRIRVTDG
jgi:hypothetical protein